MERKLTLQFVTAEGTLSTVSFRYVSSSVTAEEIKPLATAIIAASSVFKSAYSELKAATLVTTTETAIDISE